MKEQDKEVAPIKEQINEQTKERILQRILTHKTLVPEDTQTPGPTGYKTQNPKLSRPL